MTTDRVLRDVDGSISDLVIACLAGPETVAELDAPVDLVVVALELIDEALGVHAHWDTTNPVAAKAIVSGHMRRRHSELSDSALEALAEHSTRDFRRPGR